MNSTGHTSTFIFTHAPIVGHEGKGSSFRELNRKNFVNWANGDDAAYPSGGNVRGVFAGHKHQHHIFYDVTVENMDKPDDDVYDDVLPSFLVKIYYDPPDGIINSPVYVESASFKF